MSDFKPYSPWLGICQENCDTAVLTKCNRDSVPISGHACLACLVQPQRLRVVQCKRGVNRDTSPTPAV
jgi:hypothetical protein